MFIFLQFVLDKGGKVGYHYTIREAPLTDGPLHRQAEADCEGAVSKYGKRSFC